MNDRKGFLKQLAGLGGATLLVATGAGAGTEKGKEEGIGDKLARTILQMTKSGQLSWKLVRFYATRGPSFLETYMAMLGDIEFILDLFDTKGLSIKIHRLNGGLIAVIGADASDTESLVHQIVHLVTGVSVQSVLESLIKEMES